MSETAQLVLAIFLSPVIGFLLTGLITRRIGWLSGVIAVVSMATSLVLSIIVLLRVIESPAGSLDLFSINWLSVGALQVDFAFSVDPLTAMMLVVVTVISLLVQIYSTGYLAGDPGYSRFFAYMCVFTASMLGLLLVNDLLMLFIFYELVGICSYLLIGFWFHRPSAAAAAKKAFIVTRIGDFGFMISLLLIWVNVGTFEISAIIEEAPHIAGATLALIALGIVAGAVGKSAQFPLHFWLPDAMEGPTPVSALIHSATMVAAGVYLIARLFPMFVHSIEAMATVALVGGFTAIFAASMALVMYDVKRVLAYSTISQLGYMVMALGVGGFVPAMFHLLNHSFFKAMLFLSSGSLHHATNTYDMRLMGGLRKYMPWTYGAFVVGGLSLAGILPLSGFWSKDELLLYAFNTPIPLGKVVFVFGMIVAFLTAFYTFRVIFMTFHGEYKGGAEPEPDIHHSPSAHGSEPESSESHGWKAHPHESPWLMVVPLVVLAIPAVLSGLLNTPLSPWIEAFLKTPLIKEASELLAFEPHFDPVLAAVTLVLALAGIGLAYLIYVVRVVPRDFITRFAPWTFKVLTQKYGVDILAEDLITRRAFYRVLSASLDWFDRFVVDGIVNGAGMSAVRIGGGLRKMETGQVQVYGFSIFLGLIVIIAGFVILRA